MRPTALKTLIGGKRHRRELAAERESLPQRLVLLRFHRYPLFFQRYFYFDSASSSPAHHFLCAPGAFIVFHSSLYGSPRANVLSHPNLPRCTSSSGIATRSFSPINRTRSLLHFGQHLP